MNDIIIRPAIPEDVELAVPLIYSSGPKAFDYVFKSDQNSAQDFLRYAFVRPGGEFSYQNHSSILLDNEVVGAGAVFTGDDMLRFTLADGKKIVSFYKLKCLSFVFSGLSIEGLIKPPRKNEVAIGHLGIHEAARGKGLGTRLIEHLMQSPKIQNQSHYVLDVSEENPRARKLYEQMGFEVAKKCNSNLKNKYSQVVDHYRMEKRIP